MPSPVGHGIAGAALALAFDRPASSDRVSARLTIAAVLLAVAPDLDFLLGGHRGPTHSLAAAVLVGGVVWALLRGRAADAGRIALICASAWASHVLLDWLGTDTSPPMGLMALWPFSHDYFEAPVHLFSAVSRRFSRPELFWIPNLLALLRELVILGPVLLAATYLRKVRVADFSASSTSARRAVPREPAP